ncbi:MAG: hypothetical protein AB7G38_02385, partial [Dehalococcoidia bacterium]
MVESDLRRYAGLLRAAGVAVIGVSLVITMYGFSVYEGSRFALWSLAPILAGYTGLGFLTLVAVDRIAGERAYLSPRFVILLGVVALLLFVGYLVWGALPSRDPGWLKALRLPTIAGFSLLLLLFGVLDREPKAGQYGVPLGSITVVSALAFGMQEADRAPLFPLHTFAQSATYAVLIGLVIMMAGIRPWKAPRTTAWIPFTIVIAALGIMYLADVIWWSQQSAPGIRLEIAVRLAATIAAAVLVAMVMVGIAPLRTVTAGLVLVSLATLGSTTAMLDSVTEHRVFFFLTSAFHPIAMSIFALALSVAFESNRPS